jgi:heme-degrading monooxygenase HmoA
MFVTLWEFEVKPGCEESFEKAYGPEGAWVQLFRLDPHYLTTHLLRDPSRPRVYFTLDFWDSETAFLRFQTAHQEAYAALDRATEGFTLRERHLGLFRQTDSTDRTS